ncbi:MAG: alpha/beta hydrolase [Clostridiales bacterium]|nr:MAG: alpha/beta hydrolase [Clostridiales bacterium]
MTYKIWEKTPLYNKDFEQPEPSLMPFLLEGDNNPCVIVCPGGGYTGKAFDYEGTDVATWLNSLGYSAFVLDYRVSPYKAPVPLMDLQRAIKFVRYYSSDFGTDINKIGVLGFSAGGHLAATAMTHLKYECIPEDDIDNENCRPDFGILCYPVITMKNFGHEGSKISLLGENPTEKDIEFYSCETQVTAYTPPCFIWHTFEDTCVPVKNSLAFSASLSDHNIPHELHIFKKGGHGLGLACIEDKTASAWTILCENWLKEVIN